MENWDVELPATVRTSIKSIKEPWRAEIIQAITDLAEDPFPPDSIQLENFDGQYRIRVGGYRIVYSVSRSKRRVVVTRVRPRQTAYSGLER